MKKIIGITGGVGSGKSTILDILEKEYGAKIIKGDKIGHEAFEKNSDTYKKIVGHFGDQILSADGEIDHKKLAEIIFNDNNAKKWINDLIHPFALDRIKSEIKRWENDKNTDSSYNRDPIQTTSVPNKHDTDTESLNKKMSIELMIIETALMFETGCDKLCDEVWAVITDRDIRIDRLIRDRGYTKEKAISIIASQLPDKELIKKSDKTIVNNSSIDDLIKNINSAIHD